jgi:transcriptional regulator with XRE-family HTH domain
MSRPDSIGDQLRRLRMERGLTQESLAAAAGVSTDLVKKLEQGRRAGARLTSLMALSEALGVSVGELTGKRPRLEGGNRLVLGLRDALLSPDLLPGIDVSDDGGEPTPAVELAALVGRAWRAYWAGRFDDLARELPGLLAEIRVSARSRQAENAAVLAQAHQLAAYLLVHLGRDDLAAIGAERAITAAAAGDDELHSAALLGTYAWVMLHQGRASALADLAAQAAERIEPRLSTATPAQITVWGGLTVTAMASAAAASDGDMVTELAGLARAAAGMAGSDRRDYQMMFGPVQVAVQTTHARTVLGQPDQALAAAADVDPGALKSVEYGRHLIDVAYAHADMRRTDRAVVALQQARASAGAVWFRHQGPARALVADLAERQARLSPTLRDLVVALDVR